MERMFNGEMLQLARELRGWTQTELAQMTGFTQAFISQLEHGVREITTERLSILAKAVDFPPEFFYQPHRYNGIGLSVMFYRKRAGASVAHLRSLQAEVAIRRILVARLLRGVEIRTTKCFEFMDIDEFDGKVETIADLVRASWQLPLGPIRNLVSTIESAGGVVFKFPFGTRDIDAVSQWPADCPPLFFINQEASADRIRFSLAHELGHVIMHKSASEQMEFEAHRFASQFLMPAQEIRHSLTDLTLAKAASLKPYWRVSIAALVRRARDLNAITPAQYTRLQKRLSALGYRKREPVEIASEEPALIGKILNAHEMVGNDSAELARMNRVSQRDFELRFVPRQGLRLVQ